MKRDLAAELDSPFYGLHEDAVVGVELIKTIPSSGWG